VYQRFFSFSTKPFALNPDPAFLYPSRQHAAALTMLEYGIESQASFCLLSGDIGSGKTTVVRQLIKTLGDSFTVGLISNTHHRFASIMPWALSALGVVPADDSDIAKYEALTDFVIREYAQGRRTLLIIDEAQNLSVQVLEELRLLSNLNSESDIALQTLLVGQPELREKLERPELVQFAQRVSVDFHLECLSLNEARAYVRHRLTVAGGDPSIFQPEAVAFIHARANGVPRLMNQLCDLALVYAFADQRRSVDEHLVSVALQERNRGRAMRVFSADPAVVSLAPKAVVEAGSTSKRV
jgi:type II secretory pathway predicted ATPase ExeA